MWNEQKCLENLRVISGQRYLSQKLGSEGVQTFVIPKRIWLPGDKNVVVLDYILGPKFLLA